VTTTNPYYRGPVSEHFDGVRFHNPNERTTDRSLAELLRWKFAFKASRWPRSVPITRAVPAERVAGLRITMVGHATLLIQAGGINILTDPVWSARASPVQFAGPRRVTEPGIAFRDLPPIGAVLLSHNHYDHLDLPALRRLHDTFDPLMVVPLGNDTIIRRVIPKARIVAGDWGERISLADGTETNIVPANHWSSRGLRDRRMALWCGHWISTTAGSVYFAGDTGYGSGAIFRDIRERYGPSDVALVPIGAYAPRWFMAAQHADPAEALRIALETGARRALGIHWGTFQLTDEARDEPVLGLGAAVAASSIDADYFVAASPGSVHDFG
jgi:L-ascorbate metabolism protein UlaG (beta-lactamase superfamily)